MIRHQTGRILIAVAVAFLASTCVAQHALAAPQTQTPEPTAMPTGTVTATITSTGELTPTVLPAPLYFLDRWSGQIVRVETDGATRRPITHEAQPITGFDIAPDGSRLAYVSGNRLIESNVDGTDRIVKVDGQPYDPTDTAAAVAQQIQAPRYAPEGNRIAFGLNGVNLIDSGAATTYTTVLASSPYPELDDTARPEEPARFFWPRSWSPNGTRLLVDFAYYPEGGGLAIVDLESGNLVDLNTESQDTPLLGDDAWLPDSQGFLIASDVLVYGSPGLAQVDATSGEVTPIIAMDSSLDLNDDNPAVLMRAPHLAKDGTLWVFAARQTGFDTPAPYALYTVSLPGGELTAQVEEIDELGGATLWAPDTSGAILSRNLRFESTGAYGDLSWWPVDGDSEDTAFDYLPATGRNPVWGSAAYGQPSPQELAVIEQFERSLELDIIRRLNEFPVFGPSAAYPFTTPAGERYWVAHTTGMRSFSPEAPHVVALFAQDGDGWQEISRYELTGEEEKAGPSIPDYLGDGSVLPVAIDPERLWLQVEGGAGAHSGTCTILSFDGEQLHAEAGAFNSSPGVCTVEDVNGDGVNEVVIDATDPYVFCYACGVRFHQYTVLRWDGTELMPVTLMSLPESAPSDLCDRNEEALTLVEGGLWKAALQTLIDAPPDAEDPDGVFAWNQALIRLSAEPRRADAENPDHPFPLLAQVFYGDYPAAVDVMRVYSPTALFAQPSALISGTVAQGWEDMLAGWITTTVAPALQVRSRLAGAHFVRGWAEWLANPASENAIADVRRAAELQPDDPFLAESLAALTDAGALPLASQTPEPAASGDAGRLLYSAVVEGVGSVLVADLTETEAVPTMVLAEASQPALQPGGQRLAFHSTRSDMLGLGAFDLDTGHRFNFTNNLEDSLPRWNAEGNRLAFSSTRYGDGRSRVYTVWADGTSEALDLREGSDPDWSPDGSRLVYKGCDPSGANCGLWTMAIDGTDRRQLTTNPGDARPRWAPGGGKVVFMSDQRDGNWDIYSVDVAGGEVSRISFNAANDGLPAVSPDGQAIVFVSDRGGSWGIWRVGIDGGRAVAVVSDIGTLPNWLEQGVDWVE